MFVLVSACGLNGGHKKCVHCFGGETAWKVATCVTSGRWENDV